MQNIYCIGGATVDRKFKSFEPFRLATSNPVVSHSSFGGVARNIAEHLAHLTQGVHLQCIVGKDQNGELLLAELNKQGVVTKESLIINDKTTAHYYALLDEEGDLFLALADMEIYNNIPDTFTDSWKTWSKNDIIFIDTNLSTKMLNEAMQISIKNQCKLCIDPVSHAKAKKLPTDLTGIFLVKPNQNEASSITGIDIITIEDSLHAGKLIVERGVKNAVISLGAEGYVIVNETTAKHYPITKNDDIVDANGAGDAFMTGILYGLQQDKSIELACQLGAAAAKIALKSYQSVNTNYIAADLIKLI